jgi:hypothetical protein
VDAGADAGPPPDPARYGPNTGLVAMRRAQVCPGDSDLPGGYTQDGLYFFSWSDPDTNDGTGPWQVVDTRTDKVTKHEFRWPQNLDPTSPKYEALVNRYQEEQRAFLAKHPVGTCELAWSGPAWPYPDMAFWAKSTPSPDAKVEFGVRVNGGEPVVLHTFDFAATKIGEYEADGFAIHCARLSPNGKELGVIAFGCGNHFVLQQLPFRMPLDQLVTKARGGGGAPRR